MSRPASQPDASELPRATRRPLRILIADDERDSVLTLSTILRLGGYEVSGVYDGASVAVVAEEFKPDVAILDINMPGMNGFDVAKNLRARYGEDGIVLIAITGDWNASDRVLSKRSGFNQHFGKPVDPGALMGLLTNVTPQDGRRGRL
jgi:CheY-like chemotaxis protein